MIEENSEPEPKEETEELESKNGDPTEKERKHFGALEEELTESPFPPGCSWECYLANHPSLSKRIEHTEEAVLDQWINRNPRVRWDCTCKEGTMVEGNSETKMEEEDRQPAQMRGVVDAEKEIEELGSRHDSAANTEQHYFPQGCSWQCYLANHPRVSKRIKHTEEAALKHYLKYANMRKGKRDCSCKGTLIKGDKRSKPEEQVLARVGGGNSKKNKKNKQKDGNLKHNKKRKKSKERDGNLKQSRKRQEK